MELIKITSPIKENMLYDLSEQETDELFEQAKKDIKDTKLEVLSEITLGTASIIGMTGLAILAIINKIIRAIKNKYRLTARKVLEQSKELNDIYTKIEDLLKNDKDARRKHANDPIDVVYDYVVLINKADPRKVYKFQVDFLAYDPDYFIKEINDIITYINSNKNADIKAMENSLMKSIDSNFYQHHGFIEECNPALKTELYKDMKLERAIMIYKNSISSIYEFTAQYNKFISSELTCMQILETSYKQMAARYKYNKEYSDMIDRIYKKLLDNEVMSIEFNQKAMDLYTVLIRNYADRLTAIYDKLKS